ncbi:MAG TPA: GAF domain-containing protein, partial [Dehalococcoidia bacterium]|nr:GAF domain-containing protein [Dehalococcoidia bacterium]
MDNFTHRELQNLKSENDRLRSQLAKLSQLGLQITSSLDLTTVLQHVVDAACELTGAHYGALGVFDTSGRIQQFITHGISQEERGRIGDLPQGMGILGWLHHWQQPLRLADLSQHPRSVGFPPNHPTMKSFLGAPLSYQGDNLGNLYLTEKTDQQEFTPEDEHLLLLFASQAA